MILKANLKKRSSFLVSHQCVLSSLYHSHLVLKQGFPGMDHRQAVHQGSQYVSTKNWLFHAQARLNNETIGTQNSAVLSQDVGLPAISNVAAANRTITPS